MFKFIPIEENDCEGSESIKSISPFPFEDSKDSERKDKSHPWRFDWKEDGSKVYDDVGSEQIPMSNPRVDDDVVLVDVYSGKEVEEKSSKGASGMNVIDGV